MTDTTTNETSRKARRDWIDAKGNPVESGDEKDAVGFRYTHIPTARRIEADFDPDTDIGPSEAVFELSNIPEPTKTMLAIFGGLTLAGNIVSTATNPKSKGDPLANPIPDIVARFEEMGNGVWSGERGAGGPRYNFEALSKAIAAVKGETDHNPYLAKLEAKEKVTIKGKGSILYAAYAMKNTEVQKHYAKLTGAEEVKATDL
jgi:hypothetical protein